ncbi:MAG: hypothetical protein H6559_02680 [Lewinellaceae bacterium]|nr:hypothetical protein [Lewinellaceae bacterium]
MEGAYKALIEGGNSGYYGKMNRNDDHRAVGFSCRCVQGAPSNGIDY